VALGDFWGRENYAGKNFKSGLAKNRRSCSIVIVRKENYVIQTKNRIAASAAVLHETGNFAHRTHSRHARAGRARKRSCEGIPVPVEGRE
jgi:hypothetical protein